MIFECLAENIDNFIEDCKEKEYVVYVGRSFGFERYLFTKKQLLQFMKENEISRMEVFKIEDKVKIKKTVEIEE